MVCKLSVSQRKVIELSNTCSDCGYDHSMAFTKTHQNAVDFTGCLAHVEVTYQAQNNNVLRIQGYFLDAIQTHNCELYLIRGYPEMPWNLANSHYHWLLKESDIRSLSSTKPQPRSQHKCT